MRNHLDPNICFWLGVMMGMAFSGLIMSIAIEIRQRRKKYINTSQKI